MSHQNLKVGDVVEIHSLIQMPEWNGREATIIGPCQLRRFMSVSLKIEKEAVGYRLDAPWWPKRLVIPPENLRKRRPPQDWVKLCNLTDLPREVSHV